MKVVRIIHITGLKPPSFQTWAKNLLELIHIVFDVSSIGDLSRPSKDRYDCISQCRYISSLTQQVPPSKNARLNFLSNSANKHDLTNLLIDKKLCHLVLSGALFTKQEMTVACSKMELDSYVKFQNFHPHHEYT